MDETKLTHDTPGAGITVAADGVAQLLQRQQGFFATDATKDVSFRLQQLIRLRSGIQAHESEIMQALRDDLNKSEFEAYLSEVGFVLAELRHAIKHLRKWARPRRVKTPVTHFGSKSYIYPEPYGITLVMAPWNYPFQLAVAPLIGAIAAGNCCVLKPSELAPATSRVLATLVRDTFPPEHVAVVEGGVDVSTVLLAERFDFIFFTGSTSVGRVVMEAAAKHLTPVTLELGGKSPCIVHKDANVNLAAKRIAWGKFLNAGQTCVAPDYVLVDETVREQFLDRLQHHIQRFYGMDAVSNQDYPRIVNRRHFDRLVAHLGDGRTVYGGEVSAEKLSIQPTVLDEVSWDDGVMQEEIFGPILPVLTYRDLAEVVDAVNNRPKPLALYLFTENSHTVDTVMRRIPFGGGCVNDTVFHLANGYLPFGGVGESGIGGYHGQHSFDLFSHHKAVLKQTTRFDINLRYPTTKNALRKIRMFLK